MVLKQIYKGELFFGNERTYNMAVNHYVNRIETCFRSDVLYPPEESFNDESLSFHITQDTWYESERKWRSTSSILKELAQYAIAGSIQTWCLKEGKMLESPTFEPSTDKTAVQAFRIGRSLVLEGGKNNEAAEALTKAISKFQKHAQAYAWRGYVKLKLNDFKEAGKDFSRSIEINQSNPDPYYGRSKVHMIHNDWDKAIEDLDMAIKGSIPWQTVYWRARLKKGECLFHLKEFKLSSKEFSRYSRRKFLEGDPNIQRRRKAFHFLGKCMLELNKFDEAMKAFDKAHDIREGIERLPDSENLYERGKAKQLAGMKDFMSDFKAAAEQGSKEAAQMLESIG